MLDEGASGLFQMILVIAPLKKRPHPNPLPEGEGIISNEMNR